MPYIFLVSGLAVAIFGFRYFAGTGLSGLGISEDLACFLISSSIALAFTRIKWVGWYLAALFVVIFAVATGGSVLHFVFFKTYVNLSTILIANQLVDARESVISLIDPAMLVVVVFFPLFLTVVVLVKQRRASPVGFKFIGSYLVLGLGLALLTSGLSAEIFVAQQANPMIQPLRQRLSEVLLRFREDPERIRKQIVSDADTLYNSTRDRSQHLKGDIAFPLHKIPGDNAEPSPQEKPNIVIVLMESMRGLETGLASSLDAKTKWPTVAPNLRRFASEGLHFPNFYSVGTQTVSGELSTLCSVLPNFAGPQVYSSLPHIQMRCLPDILRANGYSTHWISAYSAKYANKEGFLKEHGMSEIHDATKFPKQLQTRPKIGWGASDLDGADYVLDVLDQAKLPFFAEFMTLSNHHPFNHDYGIPKPDVSGVTANSHYKNYLSGIHFTDHALGYFIEKAKEKSWFKNTYFLFLADHSVWLFPEAPALHPIQQLDAYFKSGLVIYAPDIIKTPREETIVGSQIDIAPTVMQLAGVHAENAFSGVSLMADIPATERFAVMQNENSWSIRKANQYCVALTLFCFENMFPKCGKEAKGKSVASGFTCFDGPDDLLTSAMAPDDLKDMNLDDHVSLIKKGSRIVKYNKFLLSQDAFFPTKKPSPL